MYCMPPPRPGADVNPADWMLDVTAPSQEKALGVDFSQLWASSAYAAQSTVDRTADVLSALEAAAAEKSIQHAPTSGIQLQLESDTDASCLGGGAQYAVPLSVQVQLLLGRWHQVQWRMPQYNLMRFIVTLLIAVVFGTVYFGRGQER